MESGFIDKLYGLAIGHFHKWYGIFAPVLLSWLFALYIYNLLPKNEFSFVHYSLLVLLLSLALFVYWAIYVWYYPRRSKNRLGVVIAVQVEDKDDSRYYKNDFITPFKAQIVDNSLPFDVLILKNHQSEKVETVEDARKVLHKTNCHFCVWGCVKKRDHPTKDKQYYFELRGLVVHEPIQEVQRILLVKEFTDLLPNSVAFEKNLQFNGFRFRSEQLLVALEYITGRAALLSGDFIIAIKLHEALYQSQKNKKDTPVNIDALSRLLSLEYDQKSVFEYYGSYDGDYRESIAKALFYYEGNYGALLKKAIVDFNSGDGDAKSALRTIQKAKIYACNSAWLYSKAFLNFWLEDYREALKCCDQLKEANYPNETTTVKEVVEFNEKLLKFHFKPQLYYWLGFISYYKNDNSMEADRYFQLLLDNSDKKMAELRKRAGSHVAKIKRVVGYK